VSQIGLAPLDHAWLEDVEALLADCDVLRFTRIPEPPPPGFARHWIDLYMEGRTQGTRDGFAAVDDAGRFVGLGLAPRIDRAGGETELGYIVAQHARGKGVATEILLLLTDWAMAEKQAERLVLVIDIENRASGRVAERCGYQREGVMRSIHVKDGRRAGATLWSRLPSDPGPPGLPRRTHG
jgi:RimJ/RimL family protein N-acetyltransferase